MTGFGRAELKDEDKTILVEIRSLNNKYLKINTKVSESLTSYEDRIERVLRKELFRGTVNITLEYKATAQEPKCIINKDVLKEYNDLLGEVQRDISAEQGVSLEKLISLPGVLEFKKENGNGVLTEDLWDELEKLIMLAVEDLKHMKDSEGKNLLLEIEKWKKQIISLLDKIETKAPDVLHGYRDRIQERITSLLEGTDVRIEKADLYREIAIFADKCDISEELGRLKSHLLLLGDVMKNDGPAGRKLEFIVQEMFREANTIASKSNNSDIIEDVIEIKTEIERIKEQVFNIE